MIFEPKFRELRQAFESAGHDGVLNVCEDRKGSGIVKDSN